MSSRHSKYKARLTFKEKAISIGKSLINFDTLGHNNIHGFNTLFILMILPILVIVGLIRLFT